MGLPPLAAQLIVFSKQYNLETQVDEVLHAVKKAGFDAIEIGTNQSEDSPQDFVSLLQKHSLAVSALHGGTTLDVEKTLRLMELYHTRDLCISGIGGWEGTRVGKYLNDIDAINDMGRKLAEHGCRTHYHNHAYEFAQLDNGQTGMDVITANLEQGVVDLCVDVAWVHIGGMDPVEFLQAHHGQVSYVHLKDYTGDRHWVELGSGVVPLAAVVALLPELPIQWAVYEQDTSDVPAGQSCAISRAYLQGLGF